jgi:hypothetical protein
MTKVTFHGLPAWVGAIHGPTTCDWWTSDPAQLKWDRSLLHPIDLAMTPSAAAASRIPVAQIDVDDAASAGGRTTIGPLFPGGAMMGAIWVSDGYLARLGGKLAVAVPAGVPGHDYEWRLVQYFDGEHGNRRFYGFHANVLQVQHQLSLVEVWNPGTGTTGVKPAGTWWIDLGADADPSVPPLQPGKPGPVFLTRGMVGHMTLIEPKSPPYRGSFPVDAAPWTRSARC